MEMQDKLEKFRKFNNPERIADLRRICASSITQNSRANTGGISSRHKEQIARQNMNTASQHPNRHF